MKACTFFGHRDSPGTLRSSLRAAILAMVREHGVDTFYVGHQGAFDRMAAELLETLVKELPWIRYMVVLAYLPPAGQGEHTQPTLFPDGLEFVPKRFAIVRRNDWLIRRCDCVITHVVHHCGNAYTYAAKAERMGKVIINIQ